MVAGEIHVAMNVLFTQKRWDRRIRPVALVVFLCFVLVFVFHDWTSGEHNAATCAVHQAQRSSDLPIEPIAETNVQAVVEESPPLKCVPAVVIRVNPRNRVRGPPV